MRGTTPEHFVWPGPPSPAGGVVGDSAALLAMVARQLTTAADGPTDEPVYPILAAGLLALLAADEVHVHEVTPAGLLTRGRAYSRGGDVTHRFEDAPGSAVLDWVVSSGRAFVGATAEALPRELVERWGARSAAALPVAIDGRTAAVILLLRRTSEGFDPASLEVAATLRDHAALVMAVHASRRRARVDSLTGCLNHRALFDALEDEIERARRSDAAVAVMVLDIDDFKGINDTYGHPVGDHVLRSVASTLVRVSRRLDRVARHGGDEFAVILSNTMGPRTEMAARRVIREVQSIQLPEVGPRRTVHVSVGVADWHAGEDSQSLIARADAALLASKAAGKNRVMHADAVRGAQYPHLRAV